MTIEQLFRRGGEAPPTARASATAGACGDTQLKTPKRPDRLLLALAYLLPCGPRLIARQTHEPASWCSSSREPCGVCRIGLIVPAKLQASPPQAFAAIFELSEQMAQKRG